MTDRVAVVADHQIPFHDEAAIGAVNAYLRVLRPDLIIINGDFMDFPSLSTKFKRNHSDRGQLAVELAEGQRQLAALRKAARGADIIYNEGNHELRWRTYIEERADELSPLVPNWLNLKTALEMDKYGVEFREGWDTGGALWERGGLVVTHGNWHAKGTAARSHREYYGSALFSHVHRPTMDSVSGYDGGVHIARSTGCLCNVSGPNLPPRASTTPTADSVQGFAVVDFGATRYQVHLLEVVEGVVLGLDGKEYYES